MYRYTGTHSRGRTLSLCLSLSHARTCMHVHTHTHARTYIMHTLPPSHVSFSLLLPTRHLIFLPYLSLCLSLLPICPWQRNKEPSKPGVEVKLLTVAIDIRRERESKSLQHCVLRYTCAKYRFWGEIPVKIPVRLSVPVPSPTKHLCMYLHMIITKLLFRCKHMKYTQQKHRENLYHLKLNVSDQGIHAVMRPCHKLFLTLQPYMLALVSTDNNSN